MNDMLIVYHWWNFTKNVIGTKCHVACFCFVEVKIIILMLDDLRPRVCGTTLKVPIWIENSVIFDSSTCSSVHLMPVCKTWQEHQDIWGSPEPLCPELLSSVNRSLCDKSCGCRYVSTVGQPSYAGWSLCGAASSGISTKPYVVRD